MIDLKKSFFNTVIIPGLFDESAMNMCDSLGLYVIQKADTLLFPTEQELIDHFLKIKNHPSLIGWHIGEFTPESYTKLIKKLDESRILINERLLNNSFIIKDWNSADSITRRYIKTLNQPFDFSYHFEERKLTIHFDEYYDFFPKLITSIAIRSSENKIIKNDIASLNLQGDRLEADLSLHDLPLPEAGQTIEFKLFLNDGIDNFNKHSTIAMTIFKYFMDGNKLVLQEKLNYLDISHLTNDIYEKTSY